MLDMGEAGVGHVHSLDPIFWLPSGPVYVVWMLLLVPVPNLLSLVKKGFFLDLVERFPFRSKNLADHLVF